MKYSKQDALMTKGFAILCMVVLHLFCRKGNDVFGTPIIWFDQNTPLMYWFGFYAEICVSIYSISIGYAQYLLYKKGKATRDLTIRRIIKLMINYWIILMFFSIAGLIHSSQNEIPGSFQNFFLSLILIHKYNGAWWFLSTYIIFLLIPPFIKFYPAEKISAYHGLITCLLAQIVWYFINKAGLWPSISPNNRIMYFLFQELHNLLSIFPAIMCGAFMYKGDVIAEVYRWQCHKFNSEKIRKIQVFIIWISVFVIMNLLHKAVLTLIFAIISFILFNTWEKGKTNTWFYTFLGTHSTNIWLSHMFFYATLFAGLVQTVKYPLLMLFFMLILCTVTSYAEKFFEKIIYSFVKL